MKHRIVRGLSLLLATVFLCIACNMLAFTIDTKQMRDNAWQGCLMLGEQGATPQHIGGFRSSQLDNFTSVLILKTAGYVGPESLMEKAFAGFRVDMYPQEGQSEWDAFCNYESGQNLPTGGLSYSRYWHGYTLPLRLMLCVLNVANIQMLLYFAQLAVNFLWPLIFFGAKWYLAAFFVLLVLWVLVFLCIYAFADVDEKAGDLLLPYILWITFAAYLNVGVYLLN